MEFPRPPRTDPCPGRGGEAAEAEPDCGRQHATAGLCPTEGPWLAAGCSAVRPHGPDATAMGRWRQTRGEGEVVSEAGRRGQAWEGGEVASEAGGGVRRGEAGPEPSQVDFAKRSGFGVGGVRAGWWC